MTEKGTRTLYIVADWLATEAGLMLFSLCRYLFLPGIGATYGSLGAFMHSHGVFLTLIFFPPFMLLVSYLTGYYVRLSGKSRIDELLRTSAAIAIATLAYFFVALLNDFLPMRRMHYELMLIFSGSLFVTLWPVRFAITTILKHIGERRPARPYVMVCRAGDIPGSLHTVKTLGPKLTVGYVCTPEEAPSADSPLDVVTVDDLAALVAKRQAGGIVLAPSALESDGLQRLLHTLYQLDVPVLVSPDDRAVAMGTVMKYDHVTGDPFVDITRPYMSDSMISVKRFADVVVSALGLIITSPLILGLGIAVRIQSRGPMFYSQERIGYHRRPFMIHKLRSMVADSEADGPQLSSDDDPRVTPVGRFMRKYRLDELPNLWNVLVGEMSLVGPRPEREYFIRRIVRRAPHYTLLHLVRPGLTSWGMVKYGYASDVDQMVERLRYDILYIQNLSFEVDLKILLHTFLTVVRGEGK